MGLVNRKGGKLVLPKYDEVLYSRDGVARTKQGGKVGLVNQEGVEVVPPYYDDIIAFGWD
ncbi:MAG: WG repeat-containing protein [Bacteroidia bacterium]